MNEQTIFKIELLKMVGTHFTELIFQRIAFYEYSYNAKLACYTFTNDNSSNCLRHTPNWSHFPNLMYHLQTINWTQRRSGWVRWEKVTSPKTKCVAFYSNLYFCSLMNSFCQFNKSFQINVYIALKRNFGYFLLLEFFLSRIAGPVDEVTGPIINPQ